jgi:UDP:flavonoid glycosyltransferase YjiC (YdhE family)
LKAALAAYGSRGDVQPFVCLGSALVDRGHDVEVVLPDDREDMADAIGLSSRSYPCEFGAAFAAEDGQRMLEQGRWGDYWRWINERNNVNREERHRAVVESAESADLIVCGVLLDAHCRAIGEARGVPVVTVHMSPVVPSRHYAPTTWARRRLGPLTRAAHCVSLRRLHRMQRRDVTALRRELGLSAASWRVWRRGFSGAEPCLLAYSQALFPAPADWPPAVRPAGTLRPPPSMRARLGEVGIEPELDRWLGAGPAPVFLELTGMPFLHRERLHTILRAALSSLGMRGVLAAGWGPLETTTDDTLFLPTGSVDYGGVLPRCAAVFHYGGSGTTTAGVRAGIPTLVCWLGAEQPFWGARCRELGIGDAFPFAELDAPRLREGLRKVLAPEVRARARELGRQVAAEPDGVEAAVAILESEASRDGRASRSSMRVGG